MSVVAFKREAGVLFHHEDTKVEKDSSAVEDASYTVSEESDVEVEEKA